MSRARTSDRTPPFALGWRRHLYASDLHHTVKLIGVILSDHSSYDGTNIHPTAETVARLAGVSKSTVERAIPTLRRGGWIECTGHLAGHGLGREVGRVPIYRLTVPPEATITPSSEADHTVMGDGMVNPSHRHLDPITPSSGPHHTVTHDGHTSSTVLPLGRTDRGGSADAPPPDGRDAPRPDADAVAAMLAAILPATWRAHPVDANSPQLGDALAQLTAEGWTVDNVRDACADLGQPKASPTALLASHLRKWAGRPAPRLVSAAGLSEPTGKATKATAPHPFDEANQSDLDALLRGLNAKRDALHAAIAAMLADGLRVNLQLGADDWQSVDVRSPQGSPGDEPLGDWSVQWGLYPGEQPTIDGELTEYPDDILSSLCARINECGDPGGVGDGSAHGWTARFEPRRVQITSRLSNFNRFTKLVALTRRADSFAVRWAAGPDRADQLTTTTEGDRP